MPSTFKLSYLVVGEEAPFTVEIDDFMGVWFLQSLIVEETKSSCRPDDLQIFVAKKYGRWLSTNETIFVDLVKCMNPNPILDWYLDGIQDITEYGDDSLFLCMDKEDFGPKDRIHILVLDPTKLPNPDVHFFVNNAKVRVKDTMQIDPPDLVAFWSASRHWSDEVPVDDAIQLQPGVFLVGKKELGSQVYARKCFFDIWRRIWEMFHEDKADCVAIQGNYGFGKTYFGFWMLMQLARMGKTVVYKRKEDNAYYLYSNDKVIVGKERDFRGVLDNPTTIYLVDGETRACSGAKTIIFVPVYNFDDYALKWMRVKILYLPPWTNDEILRCRELVFPTLPELVARSCFQRWGGNVRYVLDFAQDHYKQLWLDRSIDSICSSDLRNFSIGIHSSDDSVVKMQLLLHWRVSSDYTEAEPMFGSKYIEQLFVGKFQGKSRSSGHVTLPSWESGLNEFLVGWWLSENVVASRLARVIFEAYSHMKMQKGGTFRSRRLLYREDNSEVYSGTSKIKMPTRKNVIIFKDEQELATAPDSTYLRPEVGNFHGVDAIIKPNVLIYIETEGKRQCNEEGAQEVLRLLGNPSNPRIYHVLHPIDYGDLVQAQESTRKRRKLTGPGENGVSIVQFALEIPFPEE